MRRALLGGALCVSWLLAEAPEDLGTLTIGGTPAERYIRDEGFLENAPMQRTLSVEESRAIPGAQGDPIKGLSSLAGVASVNDASGQLIIHGAKPRESRVLYNQLPVGFLYHWGGLFSTVPPEATEQLDAYLGGFDVRYGNALGAVIDITPRYPIGSGSGFLHAGLYNASVGYDADLGENSALFVGARRSYFDLIVDPDRLSSSDTTVQQVPRFWDATLIGVHYTDSSIFSLEYFAGLDELKIDSQRLADRDPEATGEIAVKNGYRSLGLRWIYDPGGDYSANTLLYRSDTTIDSGFFGNTIDFINESTGLVHQSSYRLDRSRVQLGGEVVANRLPIRYDGIAFGESEGQSQPLTGRDRLNIDRTWREERYGLFAQEIRELSPRWSVRYGLRGDYATIGEYDWHVSPRAAVIWRASDRDTLSLAAGEYVQLAEGFKNSRDLGSEKLTWEKAHHLVLSYSRDLGRYGSLTLEPYHKRYFDLAVFHDGEERYKSSGEGDAQGIDITYQRGFQKGWQLIATYSYNQARRDTNTSSGRQPFYGEVPHTAQLLASRQLESGWLAGWDLGVRAVYRTGPRYTPLVRGTDGKNYTLATTAEGVEYKIPNYGEPYSQRLDDYFSLNLRLARTLQLPKSTLQMAFELTNATNHPNRSGIDYDDEYEKEGYASQLPILPWFDVTWRF